MPLFPYTFVISDGDGPTDELQGALQSAGFSCAEVEHLAGELHVSLTWDGPITGESIETARGAVSAVIAKPGRSLLRTEATLWPTPDDLGALRDALGEYLTSVALITPPGYDAKVAGDEREETTRNSRLLTMLWMLVS